MNLLGRSAPAPEEKLTVTEHLTELRQRLIKSLLALAAGTMFSWAFIDVIIAALTAPATNLYYMRPAEAFFIYLKVALVGGLVLASPIIFYQLWAFILPALTVRARSILLFFSLSSAALFVAGLAFSYFFVFPAGLAFFTAFAGDKIAPLLSIESYLDFLLMLLLPFGPIFNLPLLLIVLAQCGVLSSEKLQSARRYVIVAAFIIAGILTPPDAFTQVMLALPMLLLYELTRLFIKFVLKR